VKAIAAGYNHVLALKTDDTVWGWGMNAFGQSGPNNFVNINPTPAQIPNLIGVQSIAAGYGFSLACTTEGKAWAWGLNAQGQLGNGTQGSNPQPIPSQISGISNATSIAAGNSHGLALLSDGTMVSWGDNSYAQLGDGTTFMRLSPVPVVGIQVVAQPMITPRSATGVAPILVNVNCSTADAILHYTTNGADPTENDPFVSAGGTISITQSTILKVKGFKSGWAPSPNIDGFYTIITNAIDGSQIFVRQHYFDFLNRESDPSGLQFWINNIEICGFDLNCRDVKRINTSAAFFLSIEFQGTGYLVERIYKAAYGDATGTSTLGGTHQIKVPVVRLSEFLSDTQKIGNGLIVGQTGWEQVLENNKNAFTAEFVQRGEFTTALPTSLTPAQFVDQLFQNAGVTPAAADRMAAINEFSGAPDTSNMAARGRSLRDVAENVTFDQLESNRAFVLMQYFGYLRRNPNDPQDTDYTGYDFWLTKLNQFGGNFVKAEMVKAFISSGEYRQRFGP
jgi:hypothetical protein